MGRIVEWLGYENGEQLIELLALLKSLSDQLYSVKMMEPPEIQLQSLLQGRFALKQSMKKASTPRRKRPMPGVSYAF